jgi:hypothetical protein
VAKYSIIAQIRFAARYNENAKDDKYRSSHDLVSNALAILLASFDLFLVKRVITIWI